MPEWKQKIPKIEYTLISTNSITEELGYINGIENIKSFLNPSPFDVHDPYLLTNIEDAANTIILATQSVEKNGSKIGISYDPDCDGITSGTAMYKFLKQIVNPDYLYPIYAERTDGHGIENQLHMVQPNTELIIICDSSSGKNSIQACKILTGNNIKLVIIDHHPVELNEDGVVSNTYAIIVNPQQPGDKYPNKNLSGAGVVYKTIQVMNDSIGFPEKEVDLNLLPLVAVGLSADIMDMTEMENRYLVSEGLKNINNNPGLEAILKVAKVNSYNINSQVIGFTIGPMLNGAARMGNIKLAIDLMLSDDRFECGILAKQMKTLNDERKKIEKSTFNSLLPMVNENDKVIIVYDDDIGKSFSGLVANKFTNAYKRPAIVFNHKENHLTGSYRSVGDVNMREILRGFIGVMRDEYFNPEYGFAEGHEYAGGIGIDRFDLNLLRKYLNTHFSGTTFETALEYDLELNADDVTEDVIKEIEKFNYITGQGFPQSKFLIRNLEIMKRDVIGKNLDTVKFICGNGLVLMRFRGDSTFGLQFAPKSDDEGKLIPTHVNVLGSVNINSYYNFQKKEVIYTNQVFIDDIKLSC